MVHQPSNDSSNPAQGQAPNSGLDAVDQQVPAKHIKIRRALAQGVLDPEQVWFWLVWGRFTFPPYPPSLGSWPRNVHCQK